MDKLKSLLFILLCITVFTVNSGQREKAVFDIGFAKDNINDVSSVFLGYEKFDRRWGARFAVSILQADHTYGSVDAGVRMHFPKGGPFMGVGVSYGQNNLCDTADETCNADVSLGIYPEIGMHMWLDRNFRASIFARYFITTSDIENNYTLFGISLGF